MPDRLLPAAMVSEMQAAALADVRRTPDVAPQFFREWKPEGLRLGLTVNL